MSSTFQQHFTPDDLNMIRRVLDNAGIHHRPGEATHQDRPSASRFLITCFQQGISTELALREELHHHLYQDTSEPVRAGENADVKGWENEDGAMAAELQKTPLINRRLVAGQTLDVRRITLSYPDFTLSYASAGLEGEVPRILPMAA